DVQLVRLVDFWPTLQQNADNPSYQSYVDELVPIILHLINEESLYDLTIEELQTIQSMLQQLHLLERLTPLHDRLAERNRTVSEQLAMRYFYAGSIEDGLHVVAEMSGGTIQTRFPEDVDDLSEFEAFQAMMEHVRGRHSSLDAFLSSLHEKWQTQRESISQERIYALFVDRDDSGRAWRGRMKALSGKVELFGKSATTDEITFDNQIKSPDDPFIGVAYQSLEAVRQLIKRSGFRRQCEAYYHAHFGVKNSKQTFTGDSIGLAIGLLTYTQLLKPEILRQDNFIASDIAVTGSIDSGGTVNSVNDATLNLKIERSFFSPVRHLVVPDANLPVVRDHLEKLREQYPRRRLKLIGVESLTDAIENRNIIREEKVGLGVYVARKTLRRTRSTKLQIPILLALGYLLLCLIYPKAWVGFDWNPQYVRVTERGFQALNRDSIEVWAVEYECESIRASSKWEIGDIDGDLLNEIAFIPNISAANPCESNTILWVYQDDGSLMFQRSAVLADNILGDSSREVPWAAGGIEFVQGKGNHLVVASILRSYPSQAHITLWSLRGELLGWYVHPGMVQVSEDLFSTERTGQLVFLGINNVMGCASMFALPIDSTVGFSPPHDCRYYDSSSFVPGSQLSYILFPQTDLSTSYQNEYNGPNKLWVFQNGSTAADITEHIPDQESNICYDFDASYRIAGVSISDGFKQSRNILVSDGKLNPVDWQSYSNTLRDAVTYWSASGWVTEGKLRALESLSK
ncbi:MAG: hypothetical protein KJ723_10020, partial [candidate division Zixibacteria bacterium]|nr:hypothetical protein [candidate division Zixibacteria bacterium]